MHGYKPDWTHGKKHSWGVIRDRVLGHPSWAKARELSISITMHGVFLSIATLVIVANFGVHLEETE
jgi:hypothetical protein